MEDLKISMGQMQIDASRTVRRGDNLTRIAREEGVGLADLKKVNPDLCDVQKGRDKQCNLIFPGDEVILPPEANSVAKNSLEKSSAPSPFQSFARAMEYLGKARNAPAPVKLPPMIITEKTTASVEIFHSVEELQQAVDEGEVGLHRRVALQMGGKVELATARDLLDLSLFPRYESPEAVMRAFDRGEVDLDTFIHLHGERGGTQTVRECLTQELKARGDLDPPFTGDYWLGLTAHVEANKEGNPTEKPAAMAKAKAAPKKMTPPRDIEKPQDLKVDFEVLM